MVALLLFLLGAIAVSFLCSILESTLMSTPISYVTMREEEGYKPATRFKAYKQDSSRPIAAILSLNTIANTIGAAGVGRQAQIVFGSNWFALVSVLTTVLILVFAEIIPKTIGTTRWRRMMGFTTACISGLIFLMYPLVVCIEWLQKIITPAENEGDLEEDENAIIQNLINMDEMKAYEAMTPRVVAHIAPERMTLKTFYRDKRYLHHSRIPVYADNDEYITGYILRMEALQLMAEDKHDVTLGEIKREIPSFNEETPLDQIWDEMLRKDEQISVIIDDYGCFQGILTLEDVIETLLGSEIVDEYDTVRDMQQLALEKWKKRREAAGKAKPGKNNEGGQEVKKT